MRPIFISIVTLFLSASAFAEDLPENHVITSQGRHIEVYSVESAKLVNPKIERFDNQEGHFVRFTAALEINVVAQGNLCTAKASTVHYNIINRDPFRHELQLSSFFDANPYSEQLIGCSSYGLIRPVKLAIKLREFHDLEDGNKPFQRIFALRYKSLGGTAGVANVEVRYTTAGGLMVSVVP